MEQPKRLPSIARIAFLVHLIVAVVLGVVMVVQPTRSLGWFGYPMLPDLKPVIRALGLIILALGGVTSMYGYLAASWERVAYIVHAEIAYLGLQTIMFVVSLGIGNGPVLGNGLFSALSAVMAGLFVVAYLRRPK